MKYRYGILGRVCLLAATAAWMEGSAEAAFIRYESEINSNADIIVFHNFPTSAAKISSITVYLGDNAAFNTPPAVTSTSPSATITIGHFTPSWTATNTSADVGLVGSLGSLVVDGSSTATFQFTDFNPGETWGIFVDLVKKVGTGSAAGADFNNVLVTVYFEGIAQPLTSSCSDPNYTAGVDECMPTTFGGGKRSFPSANSADVVLNVDTPEPTAVSLAGWGLAVIALSRFRLRK